MFQFKLVSSYSKIIILLKCHWATDGAKFSYFVKIVYWKKHVNVNEIKHCNMIQEHSLIKYFHKIIKKKCVTIFVACNAYRNKYIYGTIDHITCLTLDNAWQWINDAKTIIDIPSTQKLLN